MENDSVKNYGPVTQDVYNAVLKIINAAYDSSGLIVEPSCIIPDGYVKIPTGAPTPIKRTHDSNDVADKIKTALCSVLPAGLTALGLAFNAPVVVIVAISAAGGVAGSFIQKTSNNQDMIFSNLKLQNVDLEKLTADKIQVKLTENEEKKQELLSTSVLNLDTICAELSAYEKRMADRHDIERDKNFGEWIQKFLMYAANNEQDRKLQNMRDELISHLALMKIHVYDEVQLREDGKPDIPIQDYLYDKRVGKDDEYSKVSRPAVYSDRAILARGEIC